MGAIASTLRRSLLWIFKWAIGLAGCVLLLVIASVVLMRSANPPTTAFMLAVGEPVSHRWVPIEAIAVPLQHAVVLSEDQRFYEHIGVDANAIRTALAEYADGEDLRGASTITQQVAKNLFLSSSRSLVRKTIEAGLAVLIDAIWPKRRTLEVYLNIAQFDALVFGAEAGARHYFGKPAAQLTQSEAALLAASLPNPIDFNPSRPSDYLIERQRWILAQMSRATALYPAY